MKFATLYLLYIQFLPGWFVQNLHFICSSASSNQFSKAYQIWVFHPLQQALKSYCPNIYTVWRLKNKFRILLLEGGGMRFRSLEQCSKLINGNLLFLQYTVGVVYKLCSMFILHTKDCITFFKHVRGTTPSLASRLAMTQGQPRPNC